MPAAIAPMATPTTASASSAATQQRATSHRHAAFSFALRRFQPHAAPAAWAGRALADELDAGGIERADQFHQRIDIAADDAIARFHALDRRHRQARKFGQLALVDAEQGSGGPELRGGYHGWDIESKALDISSYG